MRSPIIHVSTADHLTKAVAGTLGHDCPDPIMKHCFLILLLGFSICNLAPARAAGDAASLDLLVKTLNSTDNPQVRTILMRGMLSGLAGRRNVDAPQGWKELSNKLASSQNAEERALLQQLSQIFGDTEAMQQALATVLDTKAKTEAPTMQRNAEHDAPRLPWPTRTPCTPGGDV